MWSKELKELSKKWKAEGKSYNEFGDLLGISRSSAQNVCMYDNALHPKKRGRQFSLKKNNVLSIKREASRMKEFGEKINSPKIIARCDLDVSKWTVQRCLRRNKYKYKNAHQQIPLTEKHRAERYKLSKEWIETNHPWEITVFSDEKRFNLNGPDHWMSYMTNKQDYIRKI